MSTWLFVSDLHGQPRRFLKLFEVIARETPTAVFVGGDVLPGGGGLTPGPDSEIEDFVTDFLISRFEGLRRRLGTAYPRLFLILGNDDPKSNESNFLEADGLGVWEYIHNRHVQCEGHDVYGYSYVPPTPFLLKDWERYDVSRHVDPGEVSPEEGYRSVPTAAGETRYATIAQDLEELVAGRNVGQAVMLFHAPPYDTDLDRAALDGKMIDHVPLDPHVGSIAIRRFIEDHQPLVTLHGHIHESARLTGNWCQQIGRTVCYSAAHDGPELAVVQFDPVHPGQATRRLL